MHGLPFAGIGCDFAAVPGSLMPFTFIEARRIVSLRRARTAFDVARYGRPRAPQMPGYPATAPTFIQMPMNEIAFLTAEVIVNLAHHSPDNPSGDALQM
jgi:hypothetical protein